MKKSKYLILILAFLTCFSFILVGCGGNKDNDANSLSSPQITHSKGYVTWQPIENAEKYEYMLNGTIHYTYENTINLCKNVSIADYDVEIKVKAISSDRRYSNSSFSNTLEFKLSRIAHYNLSLDIHDLSINKDNNEIAFLISSNHYAPLIKPLYNDVDFIKVLINNSVIVKIYPNEINYIPISDEIYYYSVNIPIKKFTDKNNSIKVQFCSNNEYIIDSAYSNTLSVNL